MSAPALPPDTTGTNRQQSLTVNDFTPADLAVSCKNIAAERAKNAAKIKADNKAIQADRRSNEIATYLGIFTVIPYLATEGNYAEKDQITALDHRQDKLMELAAFKKCR